MIVIKIIGAAEQEFLRVANHLEELRQAEWIALGIGERDAQERARAFAYECLMEGYKKYVPSILEYVEYQHLLLPEGLEVTVE